MLFIIIEYIIRNNIIYRYINKNLKEIIGKNYKDFYYDFSDVKSEFSSVDDNYLDVIKTMEDPILQHISLYLVNNYKNAKSYFCKSSKPSDDIACSNLNRWLDQKKNIYTSATNCTKNSEAWTKHIVPLWNLLDQNNNGTKCIRKEIFSKNSNFPEKLKPYTCHKHVPQNYTYTDPKVISLTTEDPCSKCKTTGQACETNCTNSESTIQSSYLTSTPDNCAKVCPQISPHDFPSLIPTISISVCFTLLGVFILQFFLYKVIKNVLLLSTF
ncbi:hypothetical protein PVMG_05654 [Plasmodium vivax Mauritania I]|uniref:PIR Superfamily Protein n=1 Tax=Plasmodium vivax Mauritania I TaxID=1035515 RepID=A0A0J9TKM4_PLAVI|nr:hypothetical protein PVMG_05654 [Plasmodium vivax Mauritania I]